MRIAVIGAGVVGSGLAQVFLAAGHSVVISSRHPDRAAKVAAEIGAQTVPSNREAATGADLIVLAVPSTAIAGIADELYGVVEGTIVVDPPTRCCRTCPDCSPPRRRSRRRFRR
jgi:predicted dinucleotide-binding enzyme